MQIDSDSTSQWRSWIARPPPKGQVAGSNPAWDASKTKAIVMFFRN